MKLSNDLHSCGIPYSCNQCVLSHSCLRRGYTCTKFYPDNSDAFLESVVAYLKENTLLSKDRRLKRRVGKTVGSAGMKCDNVTIMDEYYVRLVNDTLSEIRHGHVGYVFNLSQLRDILRFERDIKVRYNEYYYEILKEN